MENRKELLQLSDGGHKKKNSVEGQETSVEKKLPESKAK